MARAKSENRLPADAGAVEVLYLADSIVNNLSHELRTPLNGIVGMLSLLLDSDLTEHQHELATTAARSSQLLLQTVADLLDHLKMDSCDTSLDLVNFVVRPMAAELVTAPGSSVWPENVDVSFVVETDVPYMVRADQAKLCGVLASLIDNACKFTNAGTVRLTVRVANTAAARPALRFDVADTGIGISAAQQRNVFEPFVQADISSTRQRGGMGLGLARARRLTQSMGGTLEVSSELGVGSTFSLVVPIEVVSPAPQSSNSGKNSLSRNSW